MQDRFRHNSTQTHPPRASHYIKPQGYTAVCVRHVFNLFGLFTALLFPTEKKKKVRHDTAAFMFIKCEDLETFSLFPQYFRIISLSGLQQ